MAKKTEAEALSSQAGAHVDATADDDAAQQEAAKQKEQAKRKRSLAADVARRRAALKQQEAERKLPTQIIFIILNSIGAALVTTMVMVLILRNLPGDSIFSEADFSKLLLLMSFLLGFFFTLLLLMRRLPPNWWQLANEFATTGKYKAPDQKWGGVLQNDNPDYVPLFDTTRKVSAAPPTLAAAKDETSFETVEAAPPESETDAASAEGAPDAPSPQALFATETPSPDASKTTETESSAVQAGTEIDQFTKAVVDAVGSAGRTVDAITRFATQLYIAGACSAVARKFLLSAKDAFALMIKALVQTGSNKMFAESFVSNVEDYAKRPAYRDLITRGQNAMDVQLLGKAAPVSEGVATIKTWAVESNKNLAPRIVTFLFTDIVDAKALGQRLGNLHAQRVIKAHDEAVTDALQKNKGTKIKHTGDGMITTFPDPARAVAAAQDIQRKLEAHNKRMPHLATNVRIAINAGEAVEEEGSFFGAAVKMTAQVCDMAKAGQILAADVIRSFCKSSQQAFQPFGEVTVPGLDKSRPVFEIQWRARDGAMEYADIGHAAG